MNSNHPVKPYSSQAIEEVLQNSTITANSQNWLLSYLDVFVLIIMLMITLEALTDHAEQPSPEPTTEKKTSAIEESAVNKIEGSVATKKQAETTILPAIPTNETAGKPQKIIAATPSEQPEGRKKAEAPVETAATTTVATPSTVISQAQSSSQSQPDDKASTAEKKTVVSTGTASALQTESTATEPPTKQETDPDQLRQQQLGKKLAQLQLQDLISIEVKQGYAQLQIQDNILFATAKATLTDSGKALLRRLIPLLQQSEGLIFIEGHTDNRPIATPQFPSNWELASARATSVLHFLVSQNLQANRLRAVSYADTMAIADNNTEAGRRKNRRVNILLKVPETGF